MTPIFVPPPQNDYVNSRLWILLKVQCNGIALLQISLKDFQWSNKVLLINGRIIERRILTVDLCLGIWFGIRAILPLSKPSIVKRSHWQGIALLRPKTWNAIRRLFGLIWSLYLTISKLGKADGLLWSENDYNLSCFHRVWFQQGWFGGCQDAGRPARATSDVTWESMSVLYRMVSNVAVVAVLFLFAKKTKAFLSAF